MTRARLLPLAMIALLGLAAPGTAGSLDSFEALGLVRFESGIRAPDFTLPGLQGARVSLSSPPGTASLLVFWSTW